MDLKKEILFILSYEQLRFRGLKNKLKEFSDDEILFAVTNLVYENKVGINDQKLYAIENVQYELFK